MAYRMHRNPYHPCEGFARGVRAGMIGWIRDFGVLVFMTKFFLFVFALLLPVSSYSGEMALFTPRKLVFNGKVFRVLDDWGRFDRVVKTRANGIYGAFLSGEHEPFIFRFNDPVEDLKDLNLKKYKIALLNEKEIYFPTDEKIISCLTASVAGARSFGYFEKLSFIYRESMSDRKLDFATSSACTAGYDFIVVDGVAYNRYDFGNYLWGAAMKVLDLPYGMVQVGSEMNAVLNTYEQNGYEAPWYGLSLTGDSKEDQIAIFKGYSSRFPSFVSP
ncbi:MAG: hypothetical protein HYW27_02800 [Candidatus Aenigmarchaeota archaeon]|nr:hypothetical protein [Candidatus Aenigmarchaeota archaeon]